MTIALLQANRNNATAGATTLACVVGVGNSFVTPQALTPGSLIVVYAGSTAGGRTFTVSDPTNGAYNNDVTTPSIAILSFPNNASSASTLTITATISGAATEIDMIVEEWGGIQTTTPLDKTVSSSNTTNTSASTGTTASLSQTNELCVSMMHVGGAAGAPPFAVTTGGWTVGPAGPWPAPNGSLIATAYLMPGASTAGVGASYSWTTTQVSRGAVATYTSIAASSQTPPLFYRRYAHYFN